MSPRLYVNKRSVLAAVVVTLTAAIFWSQSRIPQLDAKAGMGGRNSLRGLSFDPLLVVEEHMHWALRVLYTSLNWAHTNWKGMTFGLLLGAALMTLLAALPRARGGSGTVLSTLKGLLTGVPLGLCVNCATPIGQGLVAAGARLETALATMFSSPSLNPIVVTMVLALFPLHFAVVKIALTVLFVMLLMPLACRWLVPVMNDDGGTAALSRTAEAPAAYRLLTLGHELEEVPVTALTAQSWPAALAWVGRRLLGNLWFIVRVSVPLMLLAGLLGGLAVESLPAGGLGAATVSLPLLPLAALGALLPVPVAFDVIFAAVLMSSGLPAPQVMTLLLTLGLFSVFPFMVIWRQISAALAVTLLVVVVVLGLAAARAVDWYETRSTAAAVREYAAHVTAELAARPAGLSLDRAVELATAQCERLGPQAAGVCRETFIMRRAAQGESAQICDYLQERAADCRAQHRFGLMVAAATRLRDAAPCRQLGDEHEAGACIAAVVDELSRDDIGLGIRLCNAAGTTEQVRQCRFRVVQEWVRVRGDPTLCAYLEIAPEIAGCEQFAATAAAILDEDSTACAAFPGPIAEYCRTNIGQARLARAIEGDAAACDALAGSRLQSTCHAERATRLAKQSGEVAHCGSLQGTARGDCLLEATLRRIDLGLAETEARLVDSATADAVAPVVSPTTFAAPRPAPLPLLLRLEQDGLRISELALHTRPATDGPGFVRRNAATAGLVHDFVLSALDQREPFILGRGIASGDFDNDGRVDFAVAFRHGVRLYRNLGDGRFDNRVLNLGAGAYLNAFLVALVDLDDDGWLDVFVTAYGGKNLIVYNDHDDFDAPRVAILPDTGPGLGMAAAFGDIDQDGDLDIVLGNWSFGSERGFAPAHSGNVVLLNEGGRFAAQPLPGADGETLSVLLSDLDGDARPELMVGNDHDRPDIVYRLDGQSRFVAAGRELGIPVTPFHTMSIDSADFDNDQRLDIFAADMSFSAPDSTDYCAALPAGDDRQQCQDALALREVTRNRRMHRCSELSSGGAQRSCRDGVMLELAVQTRDAQLCDRLPASLASYRSFCRAVIRPLPAQEPFRQAEYLPQRARNALLMATADGRYQERAVDAGVSESFWTWNARAADLDNDGWQDLYVGNGYKFGDIHGNVLFRNRGPDGGFERAERAYGLDDRVNTPAFTYLDFDGDGDLDILAQGVNAPLRLYANAESRNNRITLHLRDRRGNRFGIGARVVIRHGTDDARTQIREIKAGGGFLSFDAPLAHFGLGSDAQVNRVELVWADGTRSQLEAPLEANRAYVIERL